MRLVLVIVLAACAFCTGCSADKSGSLGNYSWSVNAIVPSSADFIDVRLVGKLANTLNLDELEIDQVRAFDRNTGTRFEAEVLGATSVFSPANSVHVTIRVHAPEEQAAGITLAFNEVLRGSKWNGHFSRAAKQSLELDAR